MVKAGNNSEVTNTPRDHTSTTSSTTSSTTNAIVQEANLLSTDHVKINDTNFKTLVHHCLKSRDETACDAMEHWDVSNVTDCSLLFWEPLNAATIATSNELDASSPEDWVLLKGADTFNVDISKWNTSSCTTMRSMFNGAVNFDQPIASWNTHRVLDMAHMFQGARKFNQDIAGWKTDNVLDMSHMFRYASRFHANDLSTWDTSRVTNMAFMFASATHFNGKLNWNTERVQHFQSMFHNANLFNANGLATWDVSGAIDLPAQEIYGFVSMFEGAKDFDQDISHWDMKHAELLDFMFRDATTFNQDLSNWNLEQVTSLTDMFHHAKSFQQTLCWDLAGKTTGNLFDGTLNASANANISQCWDTKRAERLHSNNQNNGNHKTTKVPSMGLRFLQALVFAVVVALATYWILLIRRYLKACNSQQVMEQKITERARRRLTMPTTSHCQSHRHNNNNSGSNSDEEATDLHCNITGRRGSNETQDEDDSSDDGMVEEEEEEEEVEILFENPKDLEELRRKCFDPEQLLFGRDQQDDEDDQRMMPVEDAIPAMALMLQQEQQLRQLREARKAKRDAPILEPVLLQALGSNASKLVASSNGTLETSRSPNSQTTTGLLGQSSSVTEQATINQGDDTFLNPRGQDTAWSYNDETTTTRSTPFAPQPILGHDLDSALRRKEGVDLV